MLTSLPQLGLRRGCRYNSSAILYEEQLEIESQIVNNYQIRASAEIVEQRLGLSLGEAIKLADDHPVAVQIWLSMRTPQFKR